MARQTRLVRWLQAKGFPWGLPEHAPMTNWLSPLRLAAVGLEAVISGLFGEFADRRESQAVVRPDHTDETLGYIDKSGLVDPEDQDKCVWLDYLADTGDGWNPTRAMAELLSEPTLKVADPWAGPEATAKHRDLPRAKVLVLGGDQVYPVASPEEYERRLVAPFREASEKADPEGAEASGFGEIFAVPGNHDWYDGLRSFLGIFCRFYDGLARKGKAIGGWRTRQSRSYFAIKLPHDWWLWGLDSQLKGYIDQPQVDYFSHVAKAMHKQADDAGRPFKLIICTGYPSWTEVDPRNPNKRFGSYAYMERVINNYRTTDAAGNPGVGGKVYLAISGDTHHYARHTESGPGDDLRQYVTCGGGGAYTHPTLQAKTETFDWQWPLPGEESHRPDGRKPDGLRSFKLATFPSAGGRAESLYPSKAQSKRTAWEGLALAFRNASFTLTMMAVSIVVLRAVTPIGQLQSFQLPFEPLAIDKGGFLQNLALLAHNAGSLTFVFYQLLMCGTFAYVAGRNRRIIGVANGLVQMAIVFLCGAAALTLLKCQGSIFVYLALAGVLSGFATATALGIYFILCFRLGGGMHWNELFLSFRSTRFKSMLRMKINETGRMTLYPIGLENTETGAFLNRFFGAPRVRARFEPHLIEPPVSVG